MRKIARMRVALITGALVGWTASPGVARTHTVASGQNLQQTLDRAKNGDTIHLGAGVFNATPTPFVDSLCGNCQEQRTPVPASYGFTIHDKSLVVVGAGAEMTTLVTNAGYGVWVSDAPSVTLTRLAVTGGVRDKDGNATDAGIVIRNSNVTITDVAVRDQEYKDTSVIVGVGGVFGREGAEITLSDSRIVNNSWDGVALYRGANATVTDCVIKKGRGAGIGVTWDATCVATRNEISGFWKGIGAFGTSWVIARNNAVHHQRGWGMIATGDSWMDISNNVVFANGNCGVAAWGTGSRGRMVNNIIANNGTEKEWVCPCVGVWNVGDWSMWEFAHNIVWSNKDGNYRDIWDQSGERGNLDIDPLFVDTLTFRLQVGSPAIDSGDVRLNDRNGSRSDIGLWGGPQGRQ